MILAVIVRILDIFFRNIHKINCFCIIYKLKLVIC